MTIRKAITEELEAMRKIVVLMMISMDGVLESPSSPKDSVNGFKYGGWAAPYVDGALGDEIDKELGEPIDLLLGRTTYEVFAPYWPYQSGAIADAFNKATKYVVSDKPVDLTWEEAVLVDGDVAAKIKALKEEDGPTLQVWGSGKLIQTLLKNDLVDELHLRIFPVTIGSGQRLFEEGTIPTAFERTEVKGLPSGVVILNYKRSGPLKAGSLK
jgi:dihydrofolate reductase